MASMAYSAKNKEKIAWLKANKEFVVEQFSIDGNTYQKLANDWGMPVSTVYNIIKYHGLIGTRKEAILTKCNEDKFNINDPIFMYYAGLVAADGYMDGAHHRVVVRMAESVRDVLNILSQYFEVSSGVREYTAKSGYSTGSKLVDLTISSKKLLDILNTLNISGRKSDGNNRFPDMNNLSEDAQRMFIRGLWDADGTVYTNRMSIFIPSEHTTVSIYKYITAKFGNDIRMTERIKDCTVIGYDMSINNGQNILDWMYVGYPLVRIESKYIRQFNR